ncbi:Ig-like domain-containing protein [uncultured Polaribacter sp.]|uniref:Ig-like domain-containing protein n=1 Tax=uncultured Polaribacter sp. TaxID=174711 RepID=UPI0030DBDFDE
MLRFSTQLTQIRKGFMYVLFSMFMISCASDATDDMLNNNLVQSIVIEGSTITDGLTSQLSVVINPSTASNKEVSWSVNKPSVASISQTGLLTAVSNGEVTVTARAKDGSNSNATKVFTVSGVIAQTYLVESITINASDISDGGSKQFTVTILPSNASNKAVTWAISDTSIAEISSDGFLTPKTNGRVIITVNSTDGSNISAQKEISISGINTNLQGVIVTTSQELLGALNTVSAGENIYVKSGTYNFSSTIKITKNGEASNLINLFSHPDNSTRPQFNFSSMSENSSNRGISVEANYWHIKGIDFFAAGDNGMFIKGSNNLIENCTFSENKDTGLQIGNGGSNNTILNCDSFYNADASLENADGFACKLDAGTGNKFIGCRAWQNLDDGWDGYMRGNDNITTTYENCWAFNNGYLKNGTKGAGDGNGFKTGGSDDKLLKHNAIYKNCIAAGNLYDGFDHNSNRGDVELYNCAAYKNGRNISFSSSNIANSLVIKNTTSLSGVSSDSYNAITLNSTNNGWQNGIITNSNDFVSLEISLLSSQRDAEGNLPNIDFMKLVSNSDLIDAGIDVGLSFNGSAPDIGAFEKE